MSKVKIYKYKVINPEKLADEDNNVLEETLNSLGSLGWKVVAMANAAGRYASLILMKESGE